MCDALVSNGQVVGHICRTQAETRPVPNRRRKRWWCFKCRKHQMHTLMGSYPVEPSYYGPSFWWNCPKCNGEYVLFPGQEWIYPDEC